MSDRDARNEAIAEEEEELRQEQINEIEDAPSIVDDGSVTNLSLMPTNSLYVPSYKLKKNEMKDKAQLQKEQAYTEREIEAEVRRQKVAKEEAEKQEANAENEQSKNDDVEQVSVGDTCCIYHYVLLSCLYSLLIPLTNFLSYTSCFILTKASTTVPKSVMSVYLLYPLFFSFCLQMEISGDMCTFVELLVIVGTLPYSLEELTGLSDTDSQYEWENGDRKSKLIMLGGIVSSVIVRGCGMCYNCDHVPDKDRAANYAMHLDHLVRWFFKNKRCSDYAGVGKIRLLIIEALTTRLGRCLYLLYDFV